MSDRNVADAGAVKDASRQSRLSFRKFAEHRLRSDFKEEALDKCNLQMRAFAECGRDEGLMVVFRCREFQNDHQDHA